MAHYFDDIFHRHTNPKTPSVPSTPRHRPHHFRRSSTARSIGNRSDFEASVNGDDSHSVSSAHGLGVSAGDHHETRHRDEADEHLRIYVSDQLGRVIGGNDEEESPDEFEAMP
jgi:hypothetical protein